MATKAGLLVVMRSLKSDQVGEYGVTGLSVLARLHAGMEHAASLNEALHVPPTDVIKRLLEIELGVVGHVVRQRPKAALPGVRRQDGVTQPGLYERLWHHTGAYLVSDFGGVVAMSTGHTDGGLRSRSSKERRGEFDCIADLKV